VEIALNPDTNQFLSVAILARSVWRDFLAARRALFVYEILFKLLEAWLLVPVVALVLAIVLSRAGHVAVSNQDVLDFFLLSPSGLIYASLFGTAAVALILLELGGMMALVSPADRGERPLFIPSLMAALRNALRIVQLGATKLALLALVQLPFLLLTILAIRLLLSDHDFYYYWNDRPPIFWIAAGMGAILLGVALAIDLVLSVRWIFALPILLFERCSAPAALRASRERLRGVSWRIGCVLVGWLLATLMIGAILEVGFRFFATATLENAGERRIALILPLLVAQGSLHAAWSFVIVVGLALLVRRLYLIRSRELGFLNVEAITKASEQPIEPWNWRLACLCIPLFLVAPLILWLDVSRYVVAGRMVRVTAHRGHARAAPENTLSAIRKAIESGADYAEIDVQQTADGVVVLLHDSDLKRVAGVASSIADVRFDELRTTDVGSWFDSSFANERVPTLAEVINLSRGRIKLNIELKFYGPERQLARDVARLVREHEFESSCLITSFKHDALRDAKRHNPRLRTGLIVAFALGDVSRLEVEALSVRADFLSDNMLRAAHRRGMEVHVWTVNDAGEMIRLMERGVDNILSSDPDLAIRVRGEWANLAGTERLLLASRLLLGLDR